MLSPWISDNKGKRYFWQSIDDQATALAAECTKGMAATWIECSGKFCDNLRFECAKPIQWMIDETEDATVTDWFSEEDAGRMDCPEGKVVTGVECRQKVTWCLRKCGDYCDFKRLRCRSILPERAGWANLGVLSSAETSEVVASGMAASAPLHRVR